MFLKPAFYLIVLGLVSAAQAGDLVVLSTEETPTGTLTIYGTPAREWRPRAAVEQRQCGSNAVICAGDNTALRNTCVQLINSLSANAGQSVGVVPRSICLTVNANQCCISWADPVSGLVQGDLVNPAVTVLNRCTSNNVSGVTTNTFLNGVCTTQCLSNRPDGCNR